MKLNTKRTVLVGFAFLAISAFWQMYDNLVPPKGFCEQDTNNVMLEENNVNIEYLYALVTTDKDKAYAVMRTDDTERTEKLLLENGVELLEEDEI